MENTEKIQEFSKSIANIKAELQKDVVGQNEVVENVIIAIIEIH
jgi:ATP-dependent Clp protease ATP-binding subunit ClpA